MKPRRLHLRLLGNQFVARSFIFLVLALPPVDDGPPPTDPLYCPPEWVTIHLRMDSDYWQSVSWIERFSGRFVFVFSQAPSIICHSLNYQCFERLLFSSSSGQQLLNSIHPPCVVHLRLAWDIHCENVDKSPKMRRIRKSRRRRVTGGSLIITLVNSHHHLTWPIPSHPDHLAVLLVWLWKWIEMKRLS